jgi:hypothetical protein
VGAHDGAEAARHVAATAHIVQVRVFPPSHLKKLRSSHCLRGCSNDPSVLVARRHDMQVAAGAYVLESELRPRLYLLCEQSLMQCGARVQVARALNPILPRLKREEQSVCHARDEHDAAASTSAGTAASSRPEAPRTARASGAEGSSSSASRDMRSSFCRGLSCTGGGGGADANAVVRSTSDAALDDAPPWLVSTAAASSEARRCNAALESCLGGGGEGGTISLTAVAGCSAPWSCKHLCRRRRSTARVSGRSSRQLTITCSEYGIRSSASSSTWMCIDTRPQSQEGLGVPSRP